MSDFTLIAIFFFSTRVTDQSTNVGVGVGVGVGARVGARVGAGAGVEICPEPEKSKMTGSGNPVMKNAPQNAGAVGTYASNKRTKDLAYADDKECSSECWGGRDICQQ